MMRGAGPVQALLRDRTTDLRRVDRDGFHAWLAEQLPHWRRDPVFEQRERIRDLRRAHPMLRALERERKRAAAAEAESPEGERLRRLEEELHGVAQAIEGLAAALEQAADERRGALAEKLDAFRARRSALEVERAERTRASPERTHLLRLDAELAALRRETGADAAEARLDELVRAQGHRAGRSGGGFEEEAIRAVRGHVLPKLGEGPLVVLAGVTLGAARTELDQVIVRPGTPVEVVAVVEAKHNANDVGHGFTRRQENLAWLAGHRAAYAPERHVTKHFPTGHFDRAAQHQQDGARYRFEPASFRRFQRDAATGYILEGLYFVTRATPLAGINGGALGRIRHRAATDTRFALADDAYLDELLAWTRSLAEPVEAPDVLRLYAADPRRARQILLLG